MAKHRWIAWLAFGAWLAVISVVLAKQMAPHMVPLRRDTPVEQRTGAGQWQLTHVLTSGCDCSRTVASSLIARGPDPNAVNKAVVIGPDDELAASLVKAGFPTERVTAAQAHARYGVRGAPWLLVHRPDGTEGYSGGYAPRRPVVASDVRAQEIVAAVRSGNKVEAYPAIGCVLSND